MQFQLPSHLTMANFNFKPSSDAATQVQKSKGGSGINEYVASLFDQSLTWSDVDWLKSITSLPLVVKGILRPDDALEAVSRGASAVIVSNHGARQLDGVPATIDVLRGVVDALSGTGVEVYMDGGVRKGTDVLKALAMGAKMAFVGRPAVWGLALAGKAGVARALEIVRDELDNCMALSGCTSVSQVEQKDILVKVLSNL